MPTELVEKYISHLETLKLEKEKRLLLNQQKRQQEVVKTYEDYDWLNMFENNLLEKQTVAVLDKFIEHNKLGNFQYKFEKVQAIKRSIARSLIVGNNSEGSDEEDLIIEGYDSESEDTSSTTDSDSDNAEQLQITTRSFRQVKRPSRFTDYVI